MLTHKLVHIMCTSMCSHIQEHMYVSIDTQTDILRISGHQIWNNSTESNIIYVSVINTVHSSEDALSDLTLLIFRHKMSPEHHRQKRNEYNLKRLKRIYTLLENERHKGKQPVICIELPISNPMKHQHQVCRDHKTQFICVHMNDTIRVT